MGHRAQQGRPEQAAAHLRDGAALCELLAWLDAQPAGSVTETQVVTELEASRRRDNALQEISFDTIAGTGNRDDYEALMRCVAEHQLKPVIAQHFAMENTAEAIATLTDSAPLGKIVIDID